ncbi:D-alanyl-D-alanine carboxypeptidase/D-alanyl-D-alanine endopeptidase [Roseinatronobacter sp. NSM]|uniref:D-alanyl-D-alanine carboxypeptidase/D-alanyl-D-alanine endopeptidase n=1 Tax=Roseinatronobacter sp. NSM TaxID=3457785 RepID=UPI004036766C
MTIRGPEGDRRSMLRLLVGGGALCAVPACAEAPERSRRPQQRPAQPADRIVSRAGLGGDLSYAVMDMASGNLLEGRGGNTPLPPASVVKTLTGLYALDVLGGAYQFRTRLMTSAPVSDGVLRGDLVLAGGGDPVLGTDDLARMAADLRAAGVQRVEGRFLVWGGALPFVEQIANDQAPQAGYNATVSGLNLNFNRVHFGWTRAGSDYTVTMDGRSDRHRPAVQMARMQVVNRGSPLYTHTRAQAQDVWTVARGALGNSGSRWLPVRHPELYAGEVLRALAATQGVTLPAPQVTQSQPGGQVLVEHRSKVLTEVVRDTLRFSTNITAEALGLMASTVLAGGAAPRSLVASAAQMSDWARARYGMSSARLVDHSGLGAASRVSMVDLCNMFRRAGQDGILRGLLREHPLRDANGNIMSNPGIDVRAKTGTLYFVSALGGYVAAPGGRNLAFAMCSADLSRRAQVAGGDLDRPDGTAAWARTARVMQQDLLFRWAQAHS